MRTIPECPSCRVRMEQGFLLERTDSGRKPTEWVEGGPEKSFWTGVKLRGKETLEVATYRCPNCGLLRSYAHD